MIPAVSLADPPPMAPDEGRPVVNWAHADRVVGRMAFVCGKVVAVGHSRSVHFLNFEKTRPGRFTGIIRTGDVSKFKDSLENLYAGKLVRVLGLVRTYRGGPQIEISDPSQIEVIDKLPDLHEPPPRGFAKKDVVTVAAYNVLNLFDAIDDPNHTDEGTPPKPHDQMERVARTIRKLDADVIALEEVENRAYLQRFLDAFLIDMGYEVVLIEGNDVRGIDVCLISRIPIGEVRSHRHLIFPDMNGKPIRFRRDLLSVELRPVGGEPFEFWVVHLQSNYEGKQYAEPTRAGEAREVRKLLDARLREDPDARILVGGDFNDTWDSRALKTLVGTGTMAMRCFADQIPDQDRVSYNKQPYRSMIDFILCTPAMAKRYVSDSYHVVPGTVESSGSDHNPVVVKFRTTTSTEVAPEKRRPPEAIRP